MANVFAATPIYDGLMAEWSARPVPEQTLIPPLNKRERHKSFKQIKAWQDAAIAAIDSTPA